MKISPEKIYEYEGVICWGIGSYFKNNYEKLKDIVNILALCDSDTSKISGKLEMPLECIPPQKLTEKDVVIICVQNTSAYSEIELFLVTANIPYCNLSELFWYNTEKQVENICFADNNPTKMMKYIDCGVGVNKCNLKCSYCYLSHHKRNSEYEIKYHSPTFIRAALSQRRFGGSILINFCGDGETLLCKELPDIIEQLLHEGHYISVVTNGTVSEAIDRLTHLDADIKRIFIKFSLHYLELKRTQLLERFVCNVKKAMSVGISVSVELVPSDDLIDSIDEIKAFSLKCFGVLPHLTVTRDEGSKELKILTERTDEEYKSIWGVFESAMFDFKMQNVGKKRYEYCMAGAYGYTLILETGELYKCAGNPFVCNIFDDIDAEIPASPVGKNCCLPYCYNCHSYLALGMIKDAPAPTYYEVRDRVSDTGEHWIKEGMKEIFCQKLYDNNKQESGKYE